MESEGKGEKALKELARANAETVQRTADYTRIEEMQGKENDDWNEFRKKELDTIRTLAILQAQKEEEEHLRRKGPQPDANGVESENPRNTGTPITFNTGAILCTYNGAWTTRK